VLPELPKAPGDFLIQDAGRPGFFWMDILLPGSPFGITLKIQGPGTSAPIANGQPTWIWDGNREKPTLTPSIRLGYTWHGFLTAGRLVSC
jgi:hypothetical protein